MCDVECCEQAVEDLLDPETAGDVPVYLDVCRPSVYRSGWNREAYRLICGEERWLPMSLSYRSDGERGMSVVAPYRHAKRAKRILRRCGFKASIKTTINPSAPRYTYLSES